MRYYLDTEFNGFGGALLSLALVSEEGHVLSLVYDRPAESIEPWVAKNVIPFLFKGVPGFPTKQVDHQLGAMLIAEFFDGHEGVDEVTIVTDWPDDIRYFCQAIITGPGQMVTLPRLKFEMHRVDAYPTAIPGAIQHNAVWDAFALAEHFHPGRFSI